MLILLTKVITVYMRFFSNYISQNLVLSEYFQDFAYAWIYIDFINVLINFMKRFSVKKKKKVRVKALEVIKTLLLLILDFFVGPWALASLSYSSIKLARRLI